MRNIKVKVKNIIKNILSVLPFIMLFIVAIAIIKTPELIKLKPKEYLFIVCIIIFGGSYSYYLQSRTYLISEIACYFIKYKNKKISHEMYKRIAHNIYTLAVKGPYFTIDKSCKEENVYDLLMPKIESFSDKELKSCRRRVYITKTILLGSAISTVILLFLFL